MEKNVSEFQPENINELEKTHSRACACTQDQHKIMDQCTGICIQRWRKKPKKSKLNEVDSHVLPMDVVIEGETVSYHFLTFLRTKKGKIT